MTLTDTPWLIGQARSGEYLLAHAWTEHLAYFVDVESRPLFVTSSGFVHLPQRYSNEPRQLIWKMMALLQVPLFRPLDLPKGRTSVSKGINFLRH